MFSTWVWLRLRIVMQSAYSELCPPELATSDTVSAAAREASGLVKLKGPVITSTTVLIYCYHVVHHAGGLVKLKGPVITSTTVLIYRYHAVQQAGGSVELKGPVITSTTVLIYRYHVVQQAGGLQELKGPVITSTTVLIGTLAFYIPPPPNKNPTKINPHTK